MKKIAFGSKPHTSNTPLSKDEWVDGRQTVEETKRLTIDVSLSLHKRIKSQCAIDNQKMADVIRDLLEKQFAQEYTESRQLTRKDTGEGHREHDES